MAETIDPAEILATVRSIMMSPDGAVSGAAPNTIDVKSVEIADGFVQLIFRWDQYPDLLGMRFEAPDTTDHPAWTNWAPQSIHEWAIYAVLLQALENMQTGFLYWGRRCFDGRIVWLEVQDDERNPSWGAQQIDAGKCTETLEKAGLSTEAGVEARALGQRTIWMTLVAHGSEDVLGQAVISSAADAPAAELLWVETVSGMPEKSLMVETLLHYACTAAAGQGILRLTSSSSQPFVADLLAFGSTDTEHELVIATCHSWQSGK